MSTNITRKGQVTVPKAVREYLGLKPGTAVTFERLESGEITLRPARRAARPVSAFARLRGRATVHMTTDEIMALTRGPGQPIRGR